MSSRKPTDPPSATSARRAAPSAPLAVESAADAPHGSRPEQVYTRLRDLIVEGLVAPGTRIIETEIATRLGVSRTPVREALQRLQQEGDVYELLSIVGALEGLGAFRAAQLDEVSRRNLGRDLRAVNADFHEAGRAAPMEHSQLYDADERFHRAFVEAGGGPRLMALHDAVKPQAERYIRMYISMLTTDVGVSVAEHEAIAATIEQGRPEDAQTAVQTNWRHAAERLSKVIEMAGERGSW
jgi:DNA-binding GntR family transcriptional regulator